MPTRQINSGKLLTSTRTNLGLLIRFLNVLHSHKRNLYHCKIATNYARITRETLEFSSGWTIKTYVANVVFFLTNRKRHFRICRFSGTTFVFIGLLPWFANPIQICEICIRSILDSHFPEICCFCDMRQIMSEVMTYASCSHF